MTKEQKTYTSKEVADIMSYANTLDGGPSKQSGKALVWDRVTVVSSALKYVWTAVVFLFASGMTFAYFSSSLVRRAEFEPIKKTVEMQMPSMAEKLTALETRSANTNAGMAETSIQLGVITDTLQRVERQQSELQRSSARTVLCSMYRDGYVTELADYAARVRKKPPEKSEGYKSCMDALSASAGGK